MEYRELLELAANAAELHIGFINEQPRILVDAGWTPWNPLKDDGDALRLAVKLDIQILSDGACVVARTRVPHRIGALESIGSCKFSAARRAIVCAAAKIGKNMK